MRGIYAFSTFVVVLGKISGFARGVLFAAFLGTSVALDAYNAMLVIAGAVVFIVADQLELLVSAEAAVEHGRSAESFRTYVSHVVTVAMAIGLGLGLLALILMPLLAPLLVPGARDNTALPLLWLALMLLPLTVLHIPSRVFAALLRGSERAPLSIMLDGVQGLGFLLFGAAALAYLAGTSDTTKVLAVGLSQSCALLAVVLVQFVVLRRSIGASPLRWSSLGAVVPLGRRLAVISGLNGLGYGFTLIDRHFAAHAVPGGLSLVNYAGNISLTLRTALAYDHLYVVEFSKSKDRARSYVRAMTTCLWLTVPVCGVLPVFAHDLVRLVFERGQFTAEMTVHVGRVLAVYGVFTTGFLVWQLMFRILQLENCLRSMYGSYVAALVLSLVVTPLAMSQWGLAGSICGTISGTVYLLISGAWRLHRAGVALFTRGRLLGMLGVAAYSWLVAEGVRAWASDSCGARAVFAFAIAGGLAYAPTFVWWWRQRTPTGGVVET